MDKRRAIQIMTKAAELYRDNLEDEKVLFLYGIPSEIKKELQAQNGLLSSIKGYEVAFHRYNFLHLTEVRLNKDMVASAIHFYEKCIDKRLTENDFYLAKDGSTGNVCGCIGFVQDRNTKLNVPNTLLKKDIRDVTVQPNYKVFAVISKHYTQEKYSVISKMDKSIDINICRFSQEIEKLIERSTDAGNQFF